MPAQLEHMTPAWPWVLVWTWYSVRVSVYWPVVPHGTSVVLGQQLVITVGRVPKQKEHNIPVVHDGCAGYNRSDQAGTAGGGHPHIAQPHSHPWRQHVERAGEGLGAARRGCTAFS